MSEVLKRTGHFATNLLKEIGYFILDNFFGDSPADREFRAACQSEQDPEYRKKVNEDIQIEVGQKWRFPLDYADKYCPPVFITVLEVDGDEVKGFHSYSKTEDLYSRSYFKEKMILPSR
jgi:hypothetical protein